ncbi:MAG TPA: hypothetical protein PK504_13430, partial [Ferruginibacter sp.]|nr:hypothetical protein [Ferruginibacter sp.]
MKKIIHALVIFLLVSVVNISCKKNNNDNVDRQNIHATIRLNETYRLDLRGFGDEEGASITKQAANFSISETYREVGTGNITYSYKPAYNF